MKQTAAARRRYSKASGYKSCKPGQEKEGCSYLPPGLKEKDPLVEIIVNLNDGYFEDPDDGSRYPEDKAKWALWFLSQFLTNPKKEKTETYEQLLLRLMRMNFAPTETDVPGFTYPFIGTDGVNEKDAKLFGEYLQGFYKPLNAKAAAAFGENLALVHSAVEARTKHEIQARVAQESLVAEYNPRAKIGEPIQAARTMCGRIVFSGGRLWYAEAPIKRTAYGDIFDASKTCRWVPLTSADAVRGVYTRKEGVIGQILDSEPIEKMEKDTQIAQLTVKIQEDIAERMGKLKANGDLLEHARLAKQVSSAHVIAKKMIEKQMKIDEQLKLDTKKYYMSQMAHAAHSCALNGLGMDDKYYCNENFKFRQNSYGLHPKDSELDSGFKRKWEGEDGRMYRNQAVGGAKGRKAKTVDPAFSMASLPSFLAKPKTL